MKFKREGISRCSECPLNDRRRVYGQGDKDAKIVILGEAPGRNEELEGVPFVGAAGKELDRGLVQAGIFRRSIYISNVLPCRPPSNDISSVEGQEAIGLCKAGLEAELASLKNARVIVPVGNTALSALAIGGGITTVRGSVYRVGDRFAVPTWHPAYILRDRRNRSVWISDLKKAKEISRDGWKPPTESFNLFPTLEDVEQFVMDLQNDELFGCDLETTSLNPRYGSIVVVGLAKRGGQVLSVPLLRQGGKAYWSGLDEPKVIELLVEAFKIGKPVFHNALFDVDFLESSGVPVPHIHEDTMLLHHAIHPELSHKLGFVVSIYGETPYWKGEFLKREVGILELSDESLRTYNARDAAVLLEILPGLIQDAQELGVYEHVYRDIALGLIRPIFAMERKGILLSKSRLATWKRNLDKQIKELDHKLKSEASLPEGFNLDSDTDLRLLIYNYEASKFTTALREYAAYQVPDTKKRKDTKRYKEITRLYSIVMNTKPLLGAGVKAERTTKTGMPSVDDEALLVVGLHMRNRLRKIDSFTRKEKFEDERKRIQGALSWLSALSEYRKAHKLRSTYSSFPTDPEGAVHTSYLIHGTASGRLASRNPNLQNVPLSARKLFIARPGCVFVGRDYSNLELRIAAILSSEPRMLQAFADGANLHDLNTKGLFQIGEDDPLWKPARRAAKIYVFGRRLYGGSAKGIYLKVLAEAPELELTYADFQKFDVIFDSLYPELARWQRSIKAQVLGTKMVRNAFGRLRIFLGQSAEIEREGINHPIQSTAADLINNATIRSHSQLDSSPGSLVLQIHDELVVEAAETFAEEASRLLKEEMERPVSINGREWVFPTEGKIAKSWDKLK